MRKWVKERFVEGQNMTFDLPKVAMIGCRLLAAELVRRQVNVIVAEYNPTGNRCQGCNENNRNCSRCSLGSDCRWGCIRHDHVDLAADQFGRQDRQPIIATFGKSKVECLCFDLPQSRNFSTLGELPKAVWFPIAASAC